MMIAARHTYRLAIGRLPPPSGGQQANLFSALDDCLSISPE
jgi:hypothetical protein